MPAQRCRRSGGQRAAGSRGDSAGRSEPPAAVGRGLRRDAGARGDDAASRHRRDPGRRDDRRSAAARAASRSTRACRSTRRTSTTSSGSIVVKDLIQMTDAPAGHRKVSEIMRPAAFVPETKRVVDLLARVPAGPLSAGDGRRRVRRHRRARHRRGRRRGARRRDSRRVRPRGRAHRRESRRHVRVQRARSASSELAERLGIEIEEGEFETVGGFVLARVGRVPAVGEQFEIDGLRGRDARGRAAPHPQGARSSGFTRPAAETQQ